MASLDPWESQKLLSQYIPFVPSALVHDFSEALAFLSAHRRIVVKGLYAGHKSDRGLVFLDVRSPADLENALKNVGLPALLQKQVSGLELFLGGKRDPQFDSVLLFGMGGIYVELLEKVAARICPVSLQDVEDMVIEAGLGKLLEGFRGYKLDVAKLYNIVSKLCSFLLERKDVVEVDINPLFLGKDGELLAADARVIVQQV